MKKFKFRLKKVLEHKERLYDLARTRHAEAVQELRKEEMILESLRREYKTCLFELAEKTKKIFRVRDLGPYYRYMSFIKKEIVRQSKVVSQALRKEEALRKELMQASKEKEILNKLKEKKYNEYLYALRKEEQNFLDDITASKYARGLKN